MNEVDTTSAHDKPVPIREVDTTQDKNFSQI